MLRCFKTVGEELVKISTVVDLTSEQLTMCRSCSYTLSIKLWKNLWFAMTHSLKKKFQFDLWGMMKRFNQIFRPAASSR